MPVAIIAMGIELACNSEHIRSNSPAAALAEVAALMLILHVARML
jgi:hypothetical protein